MTLIKNLLERMTGRRTVQSRWDERWADPEFYAALDIVELAHYSVLAGYARELKPRGALLDIGCGAGIFLKHLHPDAFSTYVGVDFANAVARAPRTDPRISFVASDMREYLPAEKFDTIVFNESLHYIDDPIGELDRYATFLAPGGVFLVSLHRKPGSEKIWDKIAQRFGMIDRVIVSSQRKLEWIVGAFKPLSS